MEHVAYLSWQEKTSKFMKLHQAFVGFIDFETSFKITKKIPWEIELPTIGREGVANQTGWTKETQATLWEDHGWDLI